MENSRILLILLATFLLAIPTVRASVPPVSSPLIPGMISPLGTVNVSNLNQNSQQQSGNRSPLHPQGEQSFQQGKDQVSQSGYVPSGEATKTVVTAPSSPTPLTTTV